MTTQPKDSLTIALDAKNLLKQSFSGSFSLRTWRAMDAGANVSRKNSSLLKTGALFRRVAKAPFDDGRYTVTLRPAANDYLKRPPTVRLRTALKSLLRKHGLQCVKIQ